LFKAARAIPVITALSKREAMKELFVHRRGGTQVLQVSDVIRKTKKMSF
jgi:hypothetical protein